MRTESLSVCRHCNGFFSQATAFTVAVDFVIRNESVPTVIVNGTVNLFFKTAIGILLISNHNSFRVMFDKIASAHFI